MVALPPLFGVAPDVDEDEESGELVGKNVAADGGEKFTLLNPESFY